MLLVRAPEIGEAFLFEFSLNVRLGKCSLFLFCFFPQMSVVVDNVTFMGCTSESSFRSVCRFIAFVFKGVLDFGME